MDRRMTANAPIPCDEAAVCRVATQALTATIIRPYAEISTHSGLVTPESRANDRKLLRR